jgi:hypothetical protein
MWLKAFFFQGRSGQILQPPSHMAKGTKSEIIGLWHGDVTLTVKTQDDARISNLWPKFSNFQGHSGSGA